MAILALTATVHAMARFRMPKNADEILQLVDDANRLHKEKMKLEALVNGMLADGGKGKTAPAKVAKKSSSSAAATSNPWASAMSVAAVKDASDKNLLPKVPPLSDTDDSDDDEPLKFKNKPGAANGHVKKKQKKDKDTKEKKFKGVTAYNVFVGKESTRLRELCKEEGRPITTSEDKKELMSKVGALWKELTDEQRVPWQKLADERNVVKRAEFEGKTAPDDALSGGD